MTVATALMLVGAVVVVVMMRGEKSSMGEHDAAASDAEREPQLAHV